MLYESLISSDPGVQCCGKQIVSNPPRAVSCTGHVGPVNNSFSNYSVVSQHLGPIQGERHNATVQTQVAEYASYLPTLRPECNGLVNKSVINKRPVPRHLGPHQGERNNALVEMQIAGYSKSVPRNSQGTSDYPRPQQGYRPDTIEDYSTS